MKDFFCIHQITEFQKKVLGGIKQVVFLPKEKGSIYLVRKNTNEKKRKRSETTKDIEQKQFCTRKKKIPPKSKNMFL